MGVLRGGDAFRARNAPGYDDCNALQAESGAQICGGGWDAGSSSISSSDDASRRPKKRHMCTVRDQEKNAVGKNGTTRMPLHRKRRVQVLENKTGSGEEIAHTGNVME